MKKLLSGGKIVGIPSDSTQLVSDEMDKLRKHGLIRGEHFHFLVTSREVAKCIFTTKKLPFETSKKKVWFLFGSVHPQFSSPLALFTDSPYAETKEISAADFIYLSIPHIAGQDQMDPYVFLKEVKNIRKNNPPMVCANPDRFAHEGSPPQKIVRQGSIAHLYEILEGKSFTLGNPIPLFIQWRWTSLQKKKSPTLRIS